MELHKAIDRLIFRFNSHKQFNVKQDDINALKVVLEYIDNSKKNDIKQNLLFAKMYVYTFNILLEYYKDANIAQIQLHKELDKNIMRLYEDFKNKANDIEIENFLKDIGISSKHPLQCSKEENQIELDALFNHSKQLSQMFEGRYSLDEIRLKLNDQISEAINKYKL